MLDSILSNLFGQQHFTGADHTQNTAILTTLGFVGVIVLACIIFGMIIRQLAVVAIFLTAKFRRQPAASATQKRR